MCTNERCETADRTYESRNEWFDHESQMHRKWWRCIDGCDQSFNTLETFHSYLRRDHESLAKDSHIEDVIRGCARHPSAADHGDAQCPLCRTHLPSLSLLRRRLGKHLEELSLFALPARVSENSDDESDAEDGCSRSLPSEAENGSPLGSVSSRSKKSDTHGPELEKMETDVTEDRSPAARPTESFTLTFPRRGIEGCNTEYKGQNQRICLALHVARMHEGPQLFLCEEIGCHEFFYRQSDRRLHYHDQPSSLRPIPSSNLSPYTVEEFVNKAVQLEMDKRKDDIQDRE